MRSLDGQPLSIAAIRAHVAALGDLDTWDDAITDLSCSLVEAAHAREQLTDAQAASELATARVSIGITGNNAETRKALLTIAVAEDADCCTARVQEREARRRLAEAERRVEVARQRCRLLREAVRLAGASE